MPDPPKEDPASFTDNVDLAAQTDQPAEGSMLESMDQLERAIAGAENESETGTETDASTGSANKKKKKKKKKKTKKVRKRDRYESQNFLLRIEGTLCCASLVVAFVWTCTMFIALLIFLIWANFSVSATIQSVREQS